MWWWQIEKGAFLTKRRRRAVSNQCNNEIEIDFVHIYKAISKQTVNDGQLSGIDDEVEKKHHSNKKIFYKNNLQIKIVANLSFLWLFCAQAHRTSACP